MAHIEIQYGNLPHGDHLLHQCPVCREAVPPTTGRIFCEAHQAIYQARQQEGVSTEDLDLGWLDTFATWRERPAGFSVGQDAKLFHFIRRWEGWLFFMRGYTGRLPDWIAAQERTGSIRRFVEVPEDDVRNALLGMRPAAFQEHLEERWGQAASKMPPLPPGFWWGLRLDDLIQRALMPIYGLVGNPPGLQLSSMQYGWDRCWLTYLKLDFKQEHASAPPAFFSITSPDYLSLHGILPEPLQPKTGESVLIERDFELSGVRLSGEILYGLASATPCQFYLRKHDTLLVGESSGMASEEVTALIRQLSIINDRPDIIAQYQQELDQHQPRRFFY